MSLVRDRILVRRCNRGDRTALCQIYESYRVGLLKVAAALLDNRGEVGDVLHDVLVGFAATAGRFQLTGSLKGYLSICVANRARDVNRARQRRPTAGLDDVDVLPALDASPESETAGRELGVILDAAIAGLPPEQREVLVLRLLGPLPFRQIAESTGISVNTAMSRYRYALAKVRTALDGRYRHA
jgi:RNA polymerase sigma-70 factor (ECF subfamily)